jgi:hypothetical protein
MKFLTAGILIILTIVSGFWLSKAGKPYNTAIFTIHKLIALGAGIFMVLAIRQMYKPGEVSAAWITAIVVCAVFYIVLFATGAVLSPDKPANVIVLWAHRIAPYIMAGAAAGVWHLMQL